MRAKLQAPDFLLFLVTLALLSIGVVMVFSASSYYSLVFYDDTYYHIKRQLIAALLGLFGMVVAMRFNYYRLYRWANLILIVSMVLLILVLTMGVHSKGSTRWFSMGLFRLQPSEILKPALVIYLAKYLSQHLDRLSSFKKGLLPPLMIAGLGCGLILAQPDLGTAVTVAGTIFLMLYVAGARIAHLGILGLLGSGVVVAAILLAPYRMHRFLAFWDPMADPTGAGFQTIQSLLALGSGGLFGVGLGLSRQKLLYVPERHTDFIFAILGEELGFLGAMLVLILFAVFVWRGLKIALVAPDNFGSLLATGITCMIGIQTVINLGVVTGSLPVTGITLPLISYGGSSLLVTMVAIGILLNISRYHLGK